MDTRICRTCGVEKPLDKEHFETYKTKACVGFRYRCMDCAREYCAAKMRRLRGSKKRRGPHISAPDDVLRDGVLVRTCDICGQEKSLDPSNFRKLHRQGKRKITHPAYFYRSCLKCMYNIETEKGLFHYTRQMLNSARHRAKRDGTPCTITAKDIVIPENCPVFGYKIEVGDRHNHDKSPTLDKHNPDLGYVPGNVSVISHLANRLKSDATLEQLKKMVAYMESHDLQSKTEEANGNEKEVT